MNFLFTNEDFFAKTNADDLIIVGKKFYPLKKEQKLFILLHELSHKYTKESEISADILASVIAYYHYKIPIKEILKSLLLLNYPYQRLKAICFLFQFLPLHSYSK
jgi:hypothetical protein